jgi:hypothetical protein
VINMAGMGPPPNPNARRRNARPARTALPAEGRKGPAPKWPLLPNLTLRAKLEVAQAVVDDLGERELVDELTHAESRRLSRAAEQVAILTVQIRDVETVELEMWKQLWRLPQAVAWQRLRWNRDVAQYVRWKCLAEWGDLEAGREARQLSDRIGLTPMALLRLQWEIAADETADMRTARATRAPAQQNGSARSRLQVVDETG